MSRRKALIVGLTGGIGSGKSAVSDRLLRRGACVIDSDIVAREVVALGSVGLDAVTNRFGSLVLADDGSLNRSLLASMVFSDKIALRDLNSILHPLIEKEIHHQIAICSESKASVVVLVIPLLFETGAKERYGIDRTIVVDVPLELAVRRVVLSRQMSESEMWSRINAQMPREQRIARADFVIDNSSSLISLDEQVEKVWSELQAILA